MSNPTTPFSWQMPTSTDLVTDLPADFEVFGQAVATSMADLLGGTTGQILSKASNTNMDFTWITNDIGDITAVTAGTGLSGGGTSGAVTVSIDTAVTADLTTAQTLTNKTLTAPVINLATSAQTASYTLVLADNGKLVEISNASANNLTVPLNSSVAFPIGSQINILQTGAGQTTIVATGGVTVNGTPGLKLRAQWSAATLIKRGTDTWVAVGDLSA
jgi:hypothetical protein